MKGHYQLFEGDFMEIMPTLPENSIQLGVVDPPYNIGKDTWDKFESESKYLIFMGNLFLAYQRVLQESASLYWFHNDMRSVAKIMVWLEQNTDFVFKQMIVWNKRFTGAKNKGFFDGFVAPENLRNYPKMVEYCLFYTFQDEKWAARVFNDPAFCKPVKDYMRGERSKVMESKGFKTIKAFNQWINALTQTSGIASRHYFTDSQWAFPTEEMYLKLQRSGFWQRDYQSLRKEYEQLRANYGHLKYTFNNQKIHHSVWEYETAPGNGHPTPKPVELIKSIILHSSNEGEIVLDACAGSGTTGQAAIELKREVLLIENNAKYWNLIRYRCDEAVRKVHGKHD